MGYKTQSNQKGFSAVEALLIVVIVGITGFVGWYVWHSKQSADKSLATSNSASPAFKKSVKKSSSVASQKNPYAGWKTYTSAKDNFSVKYPQTWVLNTSNAPQQETGYDSATLTSPSKTVLNLYANTGGKGGNCTPGPNDVPFQKGNACPTLEYLSSEKLPVNNLYYATVNMNTQKNEYNRASVYLVTTYYADTTGAPSYGISLAETTTAQDTFTVNKPYMGAVFQYTFLTVYTSDGNFLPYIYIYANGSSPSFLTSQDSATIKNIIRSFTLNE